MHLNRDILGLVVIHTSCPLTRIAPPLPCDTPADIAAVAAQLRGAGIAASDAKLYSIYAQDYWSTCFTDPDGIRLEVTNYRALLRIQSSKQDKARAENCDAAYSYS